MTVPLPGGSWDCHAHVFGDPSRYPLASHRGYDPPQSPLQAYLEFLDRFGLARGVLVQPSVYGFDNRCMLDALDRAAGRLVGVAVPPPASRHAELERLHRRGVRGIRCNLLNPGGLEPRAVMGWQPVLRELGWHVAFHMDVGKAGDLRILLDRFRVPVVFDHMGRPDPELVGSMAASGGGPARVAEARPGPAHHADGTGSRAVLHLVELVRQGACFVKLSAPYRLSRESPPWQGVTGLARLFLEADPARCLWASDWPHVDTQRPVHAEDLATALADWCPDPAVLRKMMRQAPETLFGCGGTG